MRIAGIPLVIFLPLASMIFLVVWGGGLGVTFILLYETGLKQWGSVILGSALVVLVPILGYLAVRRFASDELEGDA